jgi:BNR repeat-like domain
MGALAVRTVGLVGGCLAAGSLIAVAVAGGGVSASPGASPPDRETLAKTLLANGRGRFATPATTRALRAIAGEGSSPGRTLPDGEGTLEPRPRADRNARTAAVLPRSGVANVRVNDPSADRRQVDQTTQNETTVAVAGRHVAVGFNDSQQALFTLTDGLDLTGFGYSADGGRTFRDGGTLPNPPAFANVGDPWMTADRAGRMYYATLTVGGNVGNLEVAVSRSRDGGRTWTIPTFASPNDDTLFYIADKDAVAVGRDPHVASRDDVYVAWDDFAADESGNAFDGLPVASSTDHGASWSLHYADKIVTDPSSCSFGQYIGAQPLVDPSDGTLLVAAEKIFVDDPQCSGGDVTFSEVVFRSTDGGASFGPSHTIASVTPATPTGALELGPGELIRTIEFPTLAMHGGTVWAAWNDGATGRSHIRLARSHNGGRTWTTSEVTRGTTDEIQPALSADDRGLHLAYYRRNTDNTLDTVLANSTDDGVHFTAAAATTRSFPGVVTVPQFDPQIAYAYMGDYIANVSAGGRVYLAWGDNRDVVRNFMHPTGRHDPDVFFARH